jgi:hypothetical protein
LAFLLGTILFVSVTVLSISDRDLLFGSLVQLPLLGLNIGFDAFLLGSPPIVGHCPFCAVAQARSGAS